MSEPPKQKDRLPTPDGDQNQSGLAHDSNDLPAVLSHVEPGQIKQFVTQIKSAEHQIGEHILTSLQDDDTVAVLTAVVAGLGGGQRIVSAALNPQMLQQVQLA